MTSSCKLLTAFQPFSAKWVKVLYLFYHISPNLITLYHVRIYEWVIQTFQRFTTGFFSSLDYHPDTTNDLSTHKWQKIFPTQYIVNNHTQEFWYIKLFTVIVSSSDIYVLDLYSAEEHIRCVFFILNDNLSTLSHSPMILNNHWHQPGN